MNQPLNEHRRKFLKGIGSTSALIAATGCAPAVRQSNATSPTDRVRAMQSSFRNVAPTLGPQTVRFNQTLPEALAGTLYRNGPARMQVGPNRYKHWFDGDGMVQSFRLAGDALVHQGRMVQTRRYQAETQANRLLWPGFGTDAPAGARPVRAADDMNVGNISMLATGDELLALWEAGSPWQIDPLSLETLGRKVFSADTDGLPFSAHPRRDPDGRIWSFGYSSGSGKLVLYDLSADGRLQRSALIDAPNADMVHDFAITENYLVFVLMPIEFRRDAAANAAFVNRLRWQSDQSVQILLVDKATLRVSSRFEVAPFFAFHFGNAWEDGDTVRIDIAQAPPFEPLMRSIVAATTGQPGKPLPQLPALRLRLNRVRKTAEIDELPLQGIDFPRFDERYTGRAGGILVALASADSTPASAFGFGELIALDQQSGNVKRWAYDAGEMAEEHLFVAKPGGAAGHGWILGTSYDWRNQRTSLNVFNAQQVQDGPIARATLPYHLPLGLHGQFVTA